MATASKLEQAARQSRIDPRLRSFIDNCVVPALVAEFLKDMERRNQLANELTASTECTRLAISAEEVR